MGIRFYAEVNLNYSVFTVFKFYLVYHTTSMHSLFVLYTYTMNILFLSENGIKSLISLYVFPVRKLARFFCSNF